MTVTKLHVYNDALLICGERLLSSVSEPRQPRYLLDWAWDRRAIDFCLEKGQWNFATKTVKLDYSPSVEPPFGFARAFDKPTDWIRTSAVCQDEFFSAPLLQYVDEAGFWFAHLDTIYVRYVSNDDSYGGNMAGWSVAFTELLSTYLASKIINRLTQSKERRDDVKDALKVALANAKSLDAQGEPTQFLPQGSWLRARRGGRSGSESGNQGGNLIG